MSTVRVYYASKSTGKGRQTRQTREFGSQARQISLAHQGIAWLEIEAPSSFEVEDIDLSWNQLTRIDLEPLSHCHMLKRLDLSWNRLSKVDFSPLAECKNLQTILVSGNKLNTIDLRPLASQASLVEVEMARNRLSKIDLAPFKTCTSMKTINLRSNNLTEIDFRPLAPCSDLRELDVGANRLTTIDLTPFVDGVPHLTKVEYGRQKKRGSRVTSDPFLALTNWSLALQVTDWKESSEFTEGFIDRKGWSTFAGTLQNLEAKAAQAKQSDLRSLRIPVSQIEYLLLDMRELRACPQSILLLINEMPHDLNYTNGRRRIYERAVDAAAAHIETAPSTAGFDVGRMANTAAARLVPRILEKRKEEVEHTVLRTGGGSIDLRALWKTYYGSQILRALKMEQTTNTRGLVKLQDAFGQISIRLRVEDGQ